LNGSQIQDIRSEYLSQYADHPIEVKKFTKKVSNGAGGSVNMQVEMPIFLEPIANGSTPMGGAFEFALKLIQGWIQKKNDNPVPVIINVSDGLPEPPDEIEKTILMANRIMNLQTLDGYPLIFNVHVAGSGKEIQFPENPGELRGDKMAELLFAISSKVPDSYKRAAKDLDLRNIKDNSKGFISNASPETLIKFINFGSSGGVDRTSA